MSLSEIITSGHPRQDTIRNNAFKNPSVSNETAIFKYTALVCKQVNEQMYLFVRTFPLPCFVRNCPAKSTAVWANGRLPPFRRTLVNWVIFC